jgi:hypothetical protein
MKKLIYTTLMLGGTILLFAFSIMNTANFSYSEIEDNDSSFDSEETGSFVEAEHMKTLDDKGIWYKRYRVWTDFADNITVNDLEIIITRN